MCFAPFAPFTSQALLIARALPGRLVYSVCLASLSLLLHLSPLALAIARAPVSIPSVFVPLLLVPLDSFLPGSSCSMLDMGRECSAPLAAFTLLALLAARAFALR